MHYHKYLGAQLQRRALDIALKENCALDVFRGTDETLRPIVDPETVVLVIGTKAHYKGELAVRNFDDLTMLRKKWKPTNFFLDAEASENNADGVRERLYRVNKVLVHFGLSPVIGH